MLYSKAITYLGLPLTQLSASEFWRLYRRFGKTNNDSIFSEDKSLLALQQLLRHAANEVPFYRNRFANVGFDPNTIKNFSDLERLPATTKQDIAANFPDQITATSKCYSPWRYASTSGTLERLTVIHDFRKRDYIRASQLFALKCAADYEPGLRYLEIPPNICTNVCGASDTVEPRLSSYLFDSLRQGNLFDKETISNIKGMIERQVIYRQLQLPSFNQEGLVQKAEVMDDYLNKIHDFKPHLVKALPAYLYLLALRILDGGPRPKIKKCIMPMGSSLTPYMKKVIEEAFCVPVREDYGCAELGSIGAQHSNDDFIDVFTQLFHVEIVRNGQPVNIGEPGRILISDFFNYAMPIIRYDIGDVGKWVMDRSTNKPKLVLMGRLKDCLLTADNRLVTADEITDALLSLPDVFGFQLEADDDQIDLQVVPKLNETIDEQRIKNQLKNLLGLRYDIFIQKASTIVPESSGKYRFVKNLNSDVDKYY